MCRSLCHTDRYYIFRIMSRRSLHQDDTMDASQGKSIELVPGDINISSRTRNPRARMASFPGFVHVCFCCDK
jgi:hypothetical protein